MSKKEQLSAKIDSEEKFTAIYGTSHVSIPDNWVNNSMTNPATGGRVANAPWWLRREAKRIAEGVYQTTQAIDTINASWASQYVVHVSNDDPLMVAYTHSTDDGLRDKQARTTLGKFLRRTFILLTDAQIQTLEASHRAEMTGTFELATTAEAIRYTYMNMDGDSGCMRYPPASFGIGNNRHPSEVYEAPGMGVAYTKDADGVIKSRSVVWVNPADPEDKRYVRVYGDPVLKNILTRAGYKQGNLAGAKLAKIAFVTEDSDTQREDTWVVPYLDGPGGNQSDYSGAYVVLDGDWLRVVTLEERAAIENILGGGYTSASRNTSAWVTVRPLPSNEFTSDMSGVVHVGFSHRKVWYVDVYGDTVKACSLKEASDAGLTWEARTRHNGETLVVRYALGVPRFYGLGGNFWLDNEANRLHSGHKKLSTHYYGEIVGGKWTDCGTNNVVLDGVTHTVFVSDCVTALGETEVTLHHKNETATLRKLGYLKASNNDGAAVMIHRKRATLRRTAGGTAFDTQYHSGKFVELVTGEYASKSQANAQTVFGVRLWTADNYVLTDADKLKVFMGLESVVAAEAMMASFTPNNDAGTAQAAISVIKGTAKHVSATNRSFQWKLKTNGNGQQVISDVHYGEITWESQVALAAFAKADDVLGDDGHNKLDRAYWKAGYIRDVAVVIELIKPWVDGHVATLNARIEQIALEDAGQLRLLPDPPATITVT